MTCVDANVCMFPNIMFNVKLNQTEIPSFFFVEPFMLSPPQDALSGEPWQENPMGPGPDFLFCMKPGKTFALVAPEYISGKVSRHRFGCFFQDA